MLQFRLAKRGEAARVIHSMKAVADVAARFADGEGVANDDSRQFTQHASVPAKNMPIPGMGLVPRRYLGGSGRARLSSLTDTGGFVFGGHALLDAIEATGTDEAPQVIAQAGDADQRLLRDQAFRPLDEGGCPLVKPN